MLLVLEHRASGKDKRTGHDSKQGPFGARQCLFKREQLAIAQFYIRVPGSGLMFCLAAKRSLFLIVASSFVF